MYTVSIDLVNGVVETPEMFASFERSAFPRFASYINDVLSEAVPAGVSWDTDLTWTVRSTGKIERTFAPEDVNIVRGILHDHLLP